MIFAGRLFGTVKRVKSETSVVTPAAQRMPFAMSEVLPLHTPSTRTGRIAT